ncbi:MAG: CopG family transcriptional regulator [Thermoprotei archaeon]|nr:MAG: CopG family transcriptional regulator [Thermoprotei archaeon]
MGTRVVPLRIDKEVLEVVDELVRLGVFSSRSEALRELIKTGIRSYEKLARIAKGVDKLFEIEGEEKEIPVRLSGALKQLLEERVME